MAALQVTQDTFAAEVLQADKTVVADFWAPWCGPCKMMGPVIEELSEERPDIKFVKINTDENMNLTSKFRVMSIPTLLVFKNGEVVNQSIGALQKDEVLKLLGE